jgi:hypothetical protein
MARSISRSFSTAGGELRPMQPYLNKLPADVVAALPELAAAEAQAAETEPAVGNLDRSTQALGASYRPAAVSPLPATRDAFGVDPAIVERGLRGHADTQNALAASLELSAISPRSPRADEPNFDLAWEAGDAISVAIKSTTPENEERQLRLGLGQILHYRVSPLTDSNRRPPPYHPVPARCRRLPGVADRPI